MGASMVPGSLPESIINRFRTLSLERVGRIESVWNALLQGADDEQAIREMARDLHTLKGDATIVGFKEVAVLAHRLEELLELAEQLQYRVSEDFELVVTMATQFASVLIKKKAASGIDLAGFIRQVDDVVRETRALRKPRSTNPRSLFASSSASSSSDSSEADRLSSQTRSKLAAAATDAFLEYLAARTSPSRARLHSIWQTLSQELTRMHAVDLTPLLERQRAAADSMAADLGKQATLTIESPTTVRVEPRVAEAIDMALVHLIRNALDHGIEAPHRREQAGKPRRGHIRVRTQEHAGTIQLTVEDDGAGIDLSAVRATAIARNLLDAHRIASERDLLDLLFHPGFTTRSHVTDVSGRGVGLDAVKSGLAKVGGSVRITNNSDAGATIAITVPTPSRQVRVFQFLAPGGNVNLAVSARWTPTIESLTPDAIDPIHAMQLSGTSRQTLTGAPPPKQLAVRLRWGFLEVPIRIATEPVLATAERICPTPDDYPIEVLAIDGVEALLIRPEYVAEQARTHGTRLTE